jgi:uncharacterized membrane protein YfcA
VWGDVLLFAAVGFAAQIIDGALGMAYGVTATTVLLSLGVPCRALSLARSTWPSSSSPRS